VQDIPAARLDVLAQALGRLGVDQVAAAALCQELVAAVERGRTLSLPEPYPYVYLDGRVVPVRAHGELVAMAVLLAIRVDGGETRELLGYDVGPSEDRAFWLGFLRRLMTHGVGDVRLQLAAELDAPEEVLGILRPGDSRPSS
jgi:putative transposase